MLLAAAGVGLILSSLNVRKDSDMKEYTFVVNDIRSLEIESGAAEVKLLRATDGICRVQAAESAAVNYKVWVNEGTLHVERQSKWSFFNFSLKEDFVRVYLPEPVYESLWIKSSSGGIEVARDLYFVNAIVKNSSGGVAFAAEVRSELNIQTSSGGVTVTGASPKTLFISCSSGGVSLGNMNPGSVSLHLSSGGMRLSDIHCTDLNAESSSGSIKLNDVIADGKITMECTSGSIKLDDCDAAELSIECTSGSVSGHLLTPKVWSTSATSGSVRVPANGSGGICYVKTTSGSIHFE